MKLEKIYEDDHMVAFNKPSGLLSIPDRFNADIPNLFKLAAQMYEQIFVVHRLDKDTSGIICFAKTEAAHKHLSQAFENREVEKFYMSIVAGRMQQEKGSIIAPIAENPSIKGQMVVYRKGKYSHTDFETLKVWKSYSLVKLQIHTGRTHQIRVHMKHLGCPVVADPIYFDGKAIFLSNIKKGFKLADKEGLGEERPLLSRLALHAAELRLKDINGNPLVIEAPLPKDMSATVKQLDKWG